MNILGWIKGWRLDKFFKNLLTDNKELKDITAKAVLLVEKIKGYAENPTTDMIVAIIPGDWDAALVAKVKIIIPKVLKAFAKNSPCLDKATLGERVACLIGNIKQNPDAGERTKFFHELVGAIGVALSDGKFTLSDLFLFAETLYRFLFKKKD